MSNPFEAIVKDGESVENPQIQKQPSIEEKPEITPIKEEEIIKAHEEVAERQPKERPIPKNAVREPLPEHSREDQMKIHNPRHRPTPVVKELGQGHYLDRQSGTGKE